MTASELARQVRESRTVDRAAFEERVAEEAAWLKEQLRAGTFDKPQAIVGLEYELYAVDEGTGALLGRGLSAELSTSTSGLSRPC